MVTIEVKDSTWQELGKARVKYKLTHDEVINILFTLKKKYLSDFEFEKELVNKKGVLGKFRK